MESLRVIGLIIRDLWNTADRLFRLAILVTGLWFATVVAVGMFGVRSLSASLTIMPVVAFFLAIVGNGKIGTRVPFTTRRIGIPKLSPLALLVGSKIPVVQDVLKAFYSLIAFQLLFGIYVAVVPVYRDPTWFAILVGVFSAMVFVLWGIENDLQGPLFTLLLLLFLGITVYFFFAGDSKKTQAGTGGTGVERVAVRHTPTLPKQREITGTYPLPPSEWVRVEFQPVLPEDVTVEEAEELTNRWERDQCYYRFERPRGTRMSYDFERAKDIHAVRSGSAESKNLRLLPRERTFRIRLDESEGANVKVLLYSGGSISLAREDGSPIPPKGE